MTRWFGRLLYIQIVSVNLTASIDGHSLKQLLQLQFDFNLTMTKNEHVHFFVASRGVVANKKAAVGACNDVIVYVTVIRMAFTLTNQHRVASFDCRCCYISPTSEVKCHLVTWYEFITLLTYCHDAHFL